MATTSTENSDDKIPNNKITEGLKKKIGIRQHFLKILHVIHVTKSGSSEPSSDEKELVVIYEEGIPFFKSYVVCPMTYKSISDIPECEDGKDECYYTKEAALEKAIEIELKASRKTSEGTENVKEDDVKNILLVGRTGDGKSAIANVLVNRNDENGKPLFKESASGISETKEAKMEQFDHGEKKYRVIDTIGIGDTKLSFGEVLERIIKAIHGVKYRLDHILFVTRGRMTREEIDTFNLLKSVIFCDKDDKGKFLLEDYTILVRSGFLNFENKDKCSREYELMTKESDEINSLITSCKGGRTIFIDNPPVYAEDHGASEMNDDDKTKTANLIKLKREKSRNIILKMLEKSENKKAVGNQNSCYVAKEMKELGGKIVPLIDDIKTLKELKDKTEEKELKEAYKIKRKGLEKEVLQYIKNYADKRSKNEGDKLTVINTDEVDKKTNIQFTMAAGTTLVSIGGIFMNAFVPGIGNGLSEILVGLIKSKQPRN